MNGHSIPDRSQGFTLIEVLITVVIVGVLAGVAYPAYTEHVKKTHRSHIAAVLVEEAQKLERFYSRAGQYSNASGPPVREHETSAGTALYGINATRSEQGFVLVAQPLAGAAMSGDECGEFVLHHTGRRDSTGVSSDASVQRCWGR